MGQQGKLAVKLRSGAEKTGSADPQRVLPRIGGVGELRRAAGRAPRLLVASSPARDLLFRAKHLFVAAKPGRVQRGSGGHSNKHLAGSNNYGGAACIEPAGQRQRQSHKLEALQ